MVNAEFMAEMRRPRDFWKAAALAQFFCYFCYMLFGIIVYHYQGQYASILPNLDFQNKTLILANVITFLCLVWVTLIISVERGVADHDHRRGRSLRKYRRQSLLRKRATRVSPCSLNAEQEGQIDIQVNLLGIILTLPETQADYTQQLCSGSVVVYWGIA